jgi:hypothetical protein
MIEEINASRRGFFQIFGTALAVGGLMTRPSRRGAERKQTKGE